MPTIPPVATDRELILVLLEEGRREVRHGRVLSLLRRLDVAIEADFGGGFLAAMPAEAKAVVRSHEDVKVAGGVYRRTDRALPRRIRRLAHSE